MTKQKFKLAGIIAKPNDQRVGASLPLILDILDEAGLQIIIDPVTSEYLTDSQWPVAETATMAKQIDLAITIGGDGTLLAAGHAMVDYRVPVIGINRGRLGFLTSVSPDEIRECLSTMLNGDYTHEQRSVLEATLVRDDAVIQHCRAVNDVVVHAREVIRMIELETYIDNQLLNVLRGDGLIVSTPTGSTAYALSGGGPIVEPSVPATLLVPICPHTLSNRPIMVNESSVIEVTYLHQNEISALASVDGQINCELFPGDRLTIRKSDSSLHLLQPPDHDHFRILRKKLGWSSQP